MKLELKHIAGYLPYGLKAKLSREGIFNLDSEYPNQYQNEICTIDTISISNNGFSGSMIVDISTNKYSFDFESISEIDIVLRPLSDLSKEIEVNGETLIPIDKLGLNPNWIGFNNYIKDIDGLLVFEYNILLQNHFDIFGLIEKGLAIDINTLNK